MPLSQSRTHVDRVATDPLSASSDRLIDRYRSAEHPDIGAQERSGWATYVYISEPHADEDCPYGLGPVIE